MIKIKPYICKGKILRITYSGIILLYLSISISGCSGCSRSGLRNAASTKEKYSASSIRSDRNSSRSNIVKMEQQNGIYMIPVTINDIPMHFVFDTGASLISISSTEALFLFKQGKLNVEDIKGKVDFTDANGDISEGTIIVLKKVKIGNKTLTDIEASVVNNLEAPILIGQSALSKFGKISIDYNKEEIIFE